MDVVICNIRNSHFAAFKGKRPKKKKKKKIEPIANEEQPNENEDSVVPTPPPSKRQKKKEKRLQVIVRNKDKELEKTIAYLATWDTNHDEWKYEKLRQIYIQKNIFDESAIPDEHSEVAMRYLSTSKVSTNLESYSRLLDFKRVFHFPWHCFRDTHEK